MPLADQSPSVRFSLCHLIVRGEDTVLYAPMYEDAALVVPTSATVTIYNASNQAVVSGAAATITGSIATYTVSGATTASLTLGVGWRVEWVLVVAGANVLARNDAQLIRMPLHCPIADGDLFRRVRSLDPANAAVIHNETTFQDQITEAWTRIQLRLIEQGQRPWLAMSPSSFREVAILGTLEMIFDDFASRLNPAYQTKAESYRLQFESAWGRLNWVVDLDDDGAADSSSSRHSGVQTLWLGGR